VTTAQNVIDKIRGHRLLAGISEQRDKLSTAYFVGAPELRLTYSLTGIGPGTRLSIGQTVFHVWSVTAAGLVVSVAAGEDGSPDQDAAVNSIVRVNPRYTDWAIFNEINSDLAALSAEGLFRMNTYEFDYNTQFDAFDLPLTDLQQEYELRYQTPSSRRDWPRLPKQYWRIDRNANLTDFPSGLSLRLYAALPANGYKVRLTYQAPFTPLASATSDLSTTGLPTTAYRLLEVGAVVSLAAPREMKRTQGESQPNPRRQEQIPSGGALRAYQGVAEQRRQWISEERGRLLQQWPVRGD
jgi:hypothetical protein